MTSAEVLTDRERVLVLHDSKRQISQKIGRSKTAVHDLINS